MRIRLSVTLDITRAPAPEPEIPAHDVVEGGSYIERAPLTVVGFGVPEPDEEKGLR